MSMNEMIWNEENTLHSLRRAKERAGLSRKKAEKMMSLARERGIGFEDCKWSLDRTYLIQKSDAGKKALAYNGFCFIFDVDTYECITMFPLPKCFGKKKTFYSESRRKQSARYDIMYA